MPSVAYRDFVAQNVGYAKHFEAAYRRWFPEGGCANFKLIRSVHLYSPQRSAFLYEQPDAHRFLFLHFTDNMIANI